MTLPPADQPAAPGVTKEVEDAISLYRLAVCNDLQNITHERVAARAALLAAIEKYGDERAAAAKPRVCNHHDYGVTAQGCVCNDCGYTWQRQRR